MLNMLLVARHFLVLFNNNLQLKQLSHVVLPTNLDNAILSEQSVGKARLHKYPISFINVKQVLLGLKYRARGLSLSY